MPKAFLSKRSVDGAASGPADYIIWDDGSGAIKGFGVKITPAGNKTYLFQYRVSGARTPKRFTIGRHGNVTPDEARGLAKGLALEIANGRDPSSRRRRQKAETATLAFTPYSERFIEQYVQLNWTRSRDAVSQIRRLAQPIFGIRVINEIKKADIHEVLDQLAGKPAAMKHLHAVLRKLFGWAVQRGDLEHSPMEGMKAPIGADARDRVLKDSELRHVWAASYKLGFPFGPIIRMLILTGQRRQEVAEIHWDEIDLGSGLWTIPAGRSKNGRAHLVPLGELAIAELSALREAKKSGMVFSTTETTAPSGWSRAKRRLDTLIDQAVLDADRGTEQKIVEPWRLHDLRRTLATGLQRLGVRFEVTEAVLNHVSGAKSGIAGVYQRYQWQEEKREALTLWSSHVRVLVACQPDESFQNVVHIRG